MNLRGPCPFQRLRTFVEGRSSGEDIVNDENTHAFHFADIRHPECVSDILQSLFTIEARLRLCPAFPGEDLKKHGETNQVPEGFGKKSGLIETPLS